MAVDREGRIAAIGPDHEVDSRMDGCSFEQCIDDASGMSVVPGLVDAHTHTPSGCTSFAMKERTEGFFQEQLLQQFSFTDATNLHFENPTIECSSTSVFTGVFKTNVKGNSTGQLAAQIKARGIRPFTLNNGQTVVVKICTNECTLDDDSTSEEARPWISKTSGIVIAVTVISVMLAGAALLVVILIQYRRRSFHKAIDKEQVLPLHMAPHTDLDKNFKPPYYRSISVNLPITSR